MQEHSVFNINHVLNLIYYPGGICVYIYMCMGMCKSIYVCLYLGLYQYLIYTYAYAHTRCLSVFGGHGSFNKGEGDFIHLRNNCHVLPFPGTFIGTTGDLVVTKSK